jgi:hypothetical protein
MFPTTVSQSAQSGANGRVRRSIAPRVSHQPRVHAPTPANGRSEGFKSTMAPGQPQTAPAATAATHHIAGLPTIIISWVRGQRRRKARIGWAHLAGRSRRTATMVIPIGRTHQRIAGSLVKSVKRGSAFGG